MKVGLVIIPSVHSVVRDTVKTAAGNDQYRTTLMLKLTLIDPMIEIIEESLNI